ncbi:MAG: lactate utilization protein B [Bacteroidales bacterium]|nr:lactate utilization protein B [Bacteroidales bacterium]HPS49259.1 lactate utilization protein B [Bacteroidales bacterium]
MMNTVFQKFLEDSEQRSFDSEHRKRLNYNIGRYDIQVSKGKDQYQNLELAKRRAANIKHKTLNNLDKYLAEFENNFSKRGGKVIWAPSEKEAQREILHIIKKSKAQVIVKQKTMVSEELELNELFEKNKREVFETDLGEFIVQIAGEKPYHILTPAMHKSKEDVAKLFHEKFNLPPDCSPEQITRFVRDKLRSEFIRADVGITGGNFLVADVGAVALTENEGNGLLTMAFPKIHIVIVGIEKLIPSLEDLDLFFPLLAQHGTGQHLTAYNNMVFGPKTEFEPDGPDEMFVVLLDNRRTELLGFKEQRRALSCIRCGACLNGCPIYKSIGGYSYRATYSGPIGSVISPHYLGMRDYNHLSFASTLCGKCTEVCPVKIPLHELLLYNRHEAVSKKYISYKWRIIVQGWKTLMLHRWMIDKPKSKLKNRMISRFGRKMWGTRRTLPKIAPKSFKERWKEIHP